MALVNVSELVGAIVGSEIEPKRVAKTKQEKQKILFLALVLTSQASSTQTVLPL